MNGRWLVNSLLADAIENAPEEALPLFVNAFLSASCFSKEIKELDQYSIYFQGNSIKKENIQVKVCD